MSCDIATIFLQDRLNVLFEIGGYSGVVTSSTRMYTKNELDWGRGMVSQELI